MTQQPSLDFTAHQVLIDVCENRHGGSQESIAAHEKIIQWKPERYEQIIKFILTNGPSEVHRISRGIGHGEAINRTSPRLTELKMFGLIYPLKTAAGEKIIENGSAVLDVDREELVKRGCEKWLEGK